MPMLRGLVAPTYVLDDRDTVYGRGKRSCDHPKPHGLGGRRMSLALEDMVDCAYDVIYVSSDRVRTRTFYILSVS
jgi:hypothetical protein